MNTAVAVRTEGRVGVDLASVNYGLAQSMYDKYVASVGGSGGRKKNFPGEQLSFKKGIWYRGFGDKARVLKNGTNLIVNAPNMMAGWVKWADNESGKRFPQYTPMRFPAAGDDPIERNTLGDDDESVWEKDDNGKRQDPWKPVLAFPVRIGDDEGIHHVLLSTVSSCIAAYGLYRDVMDELKMHGGELPIVTIGSDKTSRDVTKEVNGKKKTSKQTWDVPTFVISGWAEAIDSDNPTKGGVTVTADDGEAADIGTVTAKTRVNSKSVAAANGKAKAIAAPVKGKAKSRKTVEAVADDDEV